jgi:hypothetical protein
MQSLRKEKLSFLETSILEKLDFGALLPVEVDDEMIFEHNILAQPESLPSVTTGFNIASRIFWAIFKSLVDDSTSSQTIEKPCACQRSSKLVLQSTHLQERLQEVKYVLDDVPSHLQPWRDHGRGIDRDGRVRHLGRILDAQFESMRANIHITHLWAQSVIFDQINNLKRKACLHGHTDAANHNEELEWDGKEQICRQLLHVLHTISDLDLESNGNHVVS